MTPEELASLAADFSGPWHEIEEPSHKDILNEHVQVFEEHGNPLDATRAMQMALEHGLPVPASVAIHYALALDQYLDPENQLSLDSCLGLKRQTGLRSWTLEEREAWRDNNLVTRLRTLTSFSFFRDTSGKPKGLSVAVAADLVRASELANGAPDSLPSAKTLENWHGAERWRDVQPLIVENQYAVFVLLKIFLSGSAYAAPRSIEELCRLINAARNAVGLGYLSREAISSWDGRNQ